MIKVLILAGGSGTRLWPLSRKLYPKQFIQLKEFNYQSFFEKAIQRALMITNKEHIFVVTNQDYKFHIINQSGLPESQILIEPLAKNTLGAISLGVASGKGDDIFVVLSSDHIMQDEEIFAELVKKYQKNAQKSILTFGIKPTSPHTGYGYISYTSQATLPYPVGDFREKPDLKTAQAYIKDGHLWNAGIFMFSKQIFFQELKKANPSYLKLIEDDILKNFSSLPDLSIDYGLLEHSDNIKVIPLDIYWNDLGGFEAFDTYFQENNIKNPLIEIDGENSTLINESQEKVFATIGVDDLLIVETRDALLISKKGHSQKVKQVLEVLKEKNLPQKDLGMTVYRPWGSYTIIDEGPGFQSKRLSVLPGKKLSSQMHYQRSEHWVVVSGTAKVTINGVETILAKGQSTYVPLGATHRLENPGKTILHLIESQIGDYLGEDDIVRYDDEFGRV